MKLARLESIRVIIAESAPTLRKGLHKALKDAGMKNVLATGDVKQLVGTINANRVDLIIGSTDACDGKFNKIIHDLRHRNIGDNPFVVVMSLIDDPTAKSVQAAIDAGPDHLLAKPIDMKVLLGQVMELTVSRKPFVVTTDYIGPDRRTGERPGTQRIEQIEVPNPLCQRMIGQMRETTLRRAIDSVWRLVNEQKVERHAFQIGWLLDSIVPMVAANDTHNDAFDKYADRLTLIAQEMSRRIKNTRFCHIRAMVMSLANLSEEARENNYRPEDLRLLIKLSELISDCFDVAHDLDHMPEVGKMSGHSLSPYAASA